MQRGRKPKQKCEVCFFPRSSHTKTTQLISCKVCKRSAHKYCYWPELQEKNFTCDACELKNKNQVCIICGNDGLLKRTDDGIYGHPICFMLCKSALVKSYQNLSFDFIRSKKRSKLGTCRICSKNSYLQDLFQCFQNKCQERAHFYCILKDQWKNNQETNKWVQDLKIFGSSNFDFVEYYTDRIKKYIRTISLMAYKSIFGDKKIRQQNPIWIIYCKDHCENLTNCFCIQLEDKIIKTDWVYCDSCGKWYHFDCEQIIENNLQSDQYTCKCCQQWQNKIKSKQIQPIVQNYPKLQFYDFVYIQHYAESKGYKLSPSMNELIKKVPFICSIKYFNDIIKNKQFVSRVLKSVNFLSIKKQIIDKKSRKKEQIKNHQKLSKNLNETIWKMDFLVSPYPIQCLNKWKKGQYKYQQIANIFQKYNKKYSEGSNIVKPALKQLLKIKNNESDDESEESKQKSNQLIKQASNILKKQIKQLSRGLVVRENEHQNQFLTFYKQIVEHQLLKEVTKDYFNQKLPFYDVIEPIFLYDLETEMFAHVKLKFTFKQHKKILKEKKNLKQIKISSRFLQKLYNSSSKRVQIQNLHVVRQIDSQGYNRSQQQDYENNNRLIIPSSRAINNFVPKNKTRREIIKNYPNIRKSNELLQEYLESQLTLRWIDLFLKKLSLKSSSLNKLSNQYSKIGMHINHRQSSSTFKSYIKFYNTAKILFTSLSQGLIKQQEKYKVDMLQFIQAIAIDRLNLYKFCLFFISSCKLDLNNLNQNFAKVLKEKGNEYLNFISSRSMIFQCQAEYKAAFHLMEKFQYDNQKIKDLIAKNQQLAEMLENITFDSLQNLTFFQTNIQTLKEAREFCSENNLEFRISKIQYMMKFYQCKEEAFKYFLHHHIVQDVAKLPSRLAKIPSKGEVDFYLLKKFVLKIKWLKFPPNDHMYISLNDLCASRTDYFQILTSVISTYNALIKGQVNLDVPRFNKNYILYIINENKKQFVTCRPQQYQIQIICQIYDNALQKLNRASVSKDIDKNKVLAAYKQLMTCPFQVENKQQYDSLFDEKTVNQQEIIEELIGDQFHVHKSVLDETSAKGECSNKSLKMLRVLISEIKNKPRITDIEQIQKTLQNLNQYYDSKVFGPELRQMFLKCRQIHQENYSLIDKFQKGQPFDQFQVNIARKMIQTYEKQNIRIQVIESICNQLKIYDQLLASESIQENSLIKSLHQSLGSAYYNRSAASSQITHRNQQTQIRSESKQKKTRVLLRK